MTLTYRIGNDTPDSTIEITTFKEFADWLWLQGVGVDRGDERIRGFWEDAYNDLMTKPLLSPMRFTRSRSKDNLRLIIMEASEQF